MAQMESELEYVGFWLRVWASLVDTVLLLAVSFPLLRFLDWPAALSVPGDWSNLRSAALSGTSPGGSGVGDVLVDWLLPAAAIIVFWLARQATPGKMVISARIVDARTGAKPGPAQAVLRYLGYYVSIFPLGLGLIWVGLDRRKQGWHDKIAGTVVVRRRRHAGEPARFATG